MSRTRFNKVPLGKLANYSKDRIDHTSLTEDTFIGVDNLLQNKLGKTKADYSPKSGKVTKYNKGDVLIGNIRPYLKKIWYANNSGGSSADVLTIRSKEGVDSRFIYYNLLQDHFFDYVMAAPKGTRMPRGDKNHVLDYPIPDFDLKTQQNISSVLSVLDKKILLNNKSNSILEKMTKILYDYWFVQFDFPDINGKPYKTSGGAMIYNEIIKQKIPKDWEVKKLSELLPVITGKKDANFANEKGEYNFFTCGEEILKCDTFEFDGKAVLVAGNGNFNIKLFNGKFNAYQRTYVLIPYDDRNYTIVYMSVKNRIRWLTSGSRGSIVKFITKGDLEDILIPLPKSSNHKIFSSLNMLSEKIANNIEENQRLIEIRDLLLPLLLSEKVKVTR